MKRKCVKILVSFIFIMLCHAHGLAGPKLIGLNTGDYLVSFDPYKAELKKVHGQLIPFEAYMDLAYDENANKIYALGMWSNNFYIIDATSLDIEHVGNLHIDKSLSWAVTTYAVAYDPTTDTIYTAVVYWDYDYENIWSDLCIINRDTADILEIGTIPGVSIVSMSFNEEDGYLYGLAIFGRTFGPWDSPEKAHVVRINPYTAQMDVIFETPYHYVIGFAKKPGENTYYSWINWTTHFYGEIDLDDETITILGDTDQTQIRVWNAMLYKDFDLGYAPPLSTEEKPVSFHFTVQVTDVFDPENLLNISVGDNFSGELTYDINALFNESIFFLPYGISASINGLDFSSSGLDWLEIDNNYYNYYTNDVYDSLLFWSETYDTPSFGVEISLGLTDYTHTALSKNIFFPDSLNVSAWEERGFSLYVGNYGGEAVIYVQGIVDTITPTLISASIDFDPNNLNPNSKGGWITCHIELPDGYSVEDIAVETVLLENFIHAENSLSEVGANEQDGTPYLMVRFDRQALIEYLDGTTGEITLTITGEVDGIIFQGYSTINVLEKGEK